MNSTLSLYSVVGHPYDNQLFTMNEHFTLIMNPCSRLKAHKFLENSFFSFFFSFFKLNNCTHCRNNLTWNKLTMSRNIKKDRYMHIDITVNARMSNYNLLINRVLILGSLRGKGWRVRGRGFRWGGEVRVRILLIKGPAIQDSPASEKGIMPPCNVYFQTCPDQDSHTNNESKLIGVFHLRRPLIQSRRVFLGIDSRGPCLFNWEI